MGISPASMQVLNKVLSVYMTAISRENHTSRLPPLRSKLSVKNIFRHVYYVEGNTFPDWDNKHFMLTIYQTRCLCELFTTVCSFSATLQSPFSIFLIVFASLPADLLFRFNCCTMLAQQQTVDRCT